MGTVTNPLSGLIEGLLQGHALATQMHRQQQEDQAFKTNQALHEQHMSMQDIMNRQMLQDSAVPVSAMGTVENPAVQGPDNPIPGTGQAPGLPSFQRKADASRTVKYGGQSYELRTPEDQQQRGIERDSKLEQAKVQAQTDAQQSVLASQRQLRGVPVPAEFAAQYPSGQKLLPEEIYTLKQHAQSLTEGDQKIQKGYEFDLAPEQKRFSTAPTTPGGAPTEPREVASGGPPKATGDFEKVFEPAFALKHGLTVAGLHKNADLTMQAVQEYAQRTKDPETVRLAHALTQAHLDDLRSRQTTKSQPIEPGTREFRVAQDLAYGKLTMQQFRSLTAYSRDTNKKMDIYDKAAELNPNFNPAQFEMGFKFAANPKSQQQLASMDNVQKGAADLLKFSDAASRSGATTLNKFIVPGGIAIGGKKYSDFHTAQIAFADELSGALGFGGATDMAKQMGLDMTNANLSPENFRSAVETVVLPFVERKRKSMLDQMGVYGQPGMNPAAGAAAPAAPAAGAGGHTIAINGKNYIYKGTGATDDIKNYTEVKK